MLLRQRMKDLLSARSSRCRQNRKFHVVVWQTTLKHYTKKRAARVARNFFLIQPIKSLICGIVVAFAVVKS